MLASPQILILDEATSNLDTESEQLIQASMATLLAGRTTFVIAHRLSTIRRADQILVVEAGRIVERGTHDELLAAEGRYFELYTKQHGLGATPFWSTSGSRLVAGMSGHGMWEERCQRLWREATRSAALRLYKYSLLYLALIFVAVVVDHQVFR